MKYSCSIVLGHLFRIKGTFRFYLEKLPKTIMSKRFLFVMTYQVLECVLQYYFLPIEDPPDLCTENNHIEVVRAANDLIYTYLLILSDMKQPCLYLYNEHVIS